MNRLGKIVGAVTGAAFLALSGAASANATTGSDKAYVPAIGELLPCKGLDLKVISGTYRYVTSTSTKQDGSVTQVINVKSDPDLVLREYHSTYVQQPDGNWELVETFGPTYYGTIQHKFNQTTLNGVVTGTVWYTWKFTSANGTTLGTYNGKWNLANGGLTLENMVGTCAS